MSTLLEKEDKTAEKEKIVDSARKVIELEAKYLQKLSSLIGEEFYNAVKLILQTKGRVVVTGMGKSGHIANKIAATMASTGTPSFFVHPAELAHGDFGMLTQEDIVIAISNSGETSELTSILIPIKRRGLGLIGITSNVNSTLGEYSDIALDLGVDEEACPLNLAPTTSTTATLALGDALAVSLMNQRGFSKEDFAKFHPGGSLGRRLIKVSDVMRKNQGELPIINENDKHAQIIEEISKKKLGFTCVVNDNEELVGMITDGDLRRKQFEIGESISSKFAKEIMNSSPKLIDENALAYEALKVMEEFRVSDLIIISEDKKPVGIVDLKDLLKAGIY
ncbi:MAG: KpsF/GutQ family sugar-phosphate isomerase [Candidatus Caenarcaniphilales bacterium]|nr:KpsF/GutQ family sugar-phosphate isomerase [Candidatus Caenarcaniphilales bacterium]